MMCWLKRIHIVNRQYDIWVIEVKVANRYRPFVMAGDNRKNAVSMKDLYALAHPDRKYRVRRMYTYK